MTAPRFETERARGPISFGPPLRYEADIYDCEADGRLPEALCGTFYRVGPNRQYPARYREDSPFNGDGMVSMFRIADGHVQFKCRWIRTPRLIAEQQARRALFGLYRNRYTNLPEARDLPLYTANTHIYFHGGKLLALKEDGPPFAIDPHTLETEGLWDFDGALTSATFTAHPKIDLHTGEMLAFGYEAKGDATRDIAVYSIDKNGKITWELWTEAPCVSFLHDMVVTEHHIIIPTNSYTTTVERLKAGKIHWAWDPSQPVFMAVIPRGGSARDVRWIEAPRRCTGHTMNGFEDGQKLYIDHTVVPGPVYGDMFPNVDDSPSSFGGPGAYECWSVSINSRGNTPAEDATISKIFAPGLGRIDDRYLGYPYRYVFANVPHPERPADASRVPNPIFTANAVARYDRVTGNLSYGFAGDTHSLAEVVFAPRSQDAPEGEGYILGAAMDHATDKSELMVFDAMRLSEGPIARIYLPFAAPPQIHGSWTPEWDLPIPAEFRPQIL